MRFLVNQTIARVTAVAQIASIETFVASENSRMHYRIELLSISSVSISRLYRQLSRLLSTALKTSHVL
jgi:hypothetical protein